MTDEPQPADEAREERLARNEVLFRSVNEAIEQQALEFGGLDEYEFICECARSGCFDRISLTLKQYEHIRAEGNTVLRRAGARGHRGRARRRSPAGLPDRREGRSRRRSWLTRRPARRRLAGDAPRRLSAGQASASRAASPSRCSGITLTSASTGMKFVSPAQRGTTCRWPWSGIPAPAMRPMFQPRLKPSGPYVARERVQTLRAEPVDLERLGLVEVAEVHAVPVRRDEQVARRSTGIC